MERDFGKIVESTKKITGFENLKNEARVKEYVKAFSFDLAAFTEFINNFKVKIQSHYLTPNRITNSESS